MAVKKRIFLFVSLFYIFYLIFPLFADILSIPKWLPSVAASAIMVFLYPKAFNNKTFFWFLAYVFVLLLYLTLGRPLTIGIGSVADSFKIIIESSYILPPVSMFCILYFLKDLELIKKLVLWSIGILFVSFIVEVPLMRQYESLRTAYIEEQQDLQLSIPGLPGYSLMHAYTLFLPLFCYLFKVKKGKIKVLVLLGLLVLCFVVYETFVTTSLLMMTGILLFTIFYSEKGNTTFFIIYSIIVFVFYILYVNGFFISLIDWIMPAFDGTPVQDKLNDFKESIMQGQLTGGSITGRMNHHDISINAFLNNPLLGSATAGGHSSILDRLGGNGLIVAVPFLMVFISNIRQFLKCYKSKIAKDFYWACVVLAFVYLYFKGNWGNESWLVFLTITPMGILVFDKNER